MIEFKADCGHTIRAKDGDEGKVVRCSYCGRTSQVPDKAEDEFESLFSEVADLEAGESVSAGTTIPRKRRERAKAGRMPRASRSAETGNGFNPFGWVLTMGCVAGVLIVVIVCGKLGYNYYVGRTERDQPTRERREHDNPPPTGPRGGVAAPDPGSQPHRPGLIGVLLPTKKGGIYVNSVPEAATVRLRVRDSETEGLIDEIYLDERAEQAETDSPIPLDPGEYEVVVALPINNKQLMSYPGYEGLRRLVQQGGSARRMEDLFLPDESEEFDAFELPNRQWVVARLYHVEVIGRQWVALTALFLPDQPVSELIGYLPKDDGYALDQDQVESELSFWGVPEADHTYLLDALRKVGTITYRTGAPPSYRSFMIAPVGGAITSWSTGSR
jgi:hypothetical protein